MRDLLPWSLLGAGPWIRRGGSRARTRFGRSTRNRSGGNVMEKRQRMHRVAIAGSLVVAVFVGAALGPAMATAVGNFVMIKGPKGNHVAKVGKDGRLLVDGEGGVIGPAGNGYVKTFSLTSPSGETVLASAGAPIARHGNGIITGISVDVAPTASGPVTVVLRIGSRTIWRG